MKRTIRTNEIGKSGRRLLSGAFLALGAVLLSGGLAAGARAATVTVDCSTGDKLQTAVDAARPGDTILVRGVCAENLTVRDEAARITLDGQDSATIAGPNPGAATIQVLGRGITIRGFTLTGGSAGVQLFRGGTAIIERNTIQDTIAAPGSTQGGQGINVAQHSYAVIIGNTIQRNPISGIIVHEGSSARIGVQNPDDATPRGNVIRNNGVNGGVRINRTSSARLAGNTISDNAGPGVSVLGTSFAVVSSSQIDGNAGDGVWVTQNSAVQLGGDLGVLGPPNETGVLNGGFGIRCSVNSSAEGRLATLNGKEGATEFDRSTDRLERDK